MDEFPLDHARQELRTEFLAVLAAGRELDPRLDGELADVFVSHVDTVYRHPLERQSPSGLRHLLVPLLAAAALLAFLLGASFPGGHGDDRVSPFPVAPRYGEHHFWGGPQWQVPVPAPPDTGSAPHSNV